MIDWLLAHAEYSFLLVIAAALKEEITKGFLGRTSVVVNTAIVLVVASSVWTSLPMLLRGWAILGVPIGIVAFVSYMTNRSLPKRYYQLTFFLYNSIFAAAFLVFFKW